MSHFTVTVKVTQERLKKNKYDLAKAVDQMLAPYDETTKKKEFVSFEDREDEWRKEYEEGSSLEGEEEVPFTKLYKTFEKFCADWHGVSKRDKVAGRFGYNTNKNGKWDWYVVGGRWTGFYNVKGQKNKQDAVEIQDLDLEYNAKKQQKLMDDFLKEYDDLLNGKEFDVFEGPRMKALDLDLLRVVIDDEPLIVGPNEIAIPWVHRKGHDVYTKIEDKEQFKSEFASCFNPLNTYALVDDEGWHDPGKMGWFGCSQAEAKDKIEFQKGFYDRITKGAQNEILVLVDCHV